MVGGRIANESRAFPGSACRRFAWWAGVCRQAQMGVLLGVLWHIAWRTAGRAKPVHPVVFFGVF
jgi:hypothetical protein